MRTGLNVIHLFKDDKKYNLCGSCSVRTMPIYWTATHSNLMTFPSEDCFVRF